jgi:hypothetical protein
MARTDLEIHDVERREDLEGSDHKFAEYLRQHNWNRKAEFIGDASLFLKPNKEQIAIAVYDNKECTYKVYTPKEAK